MLRAAFDLGVNAHLRNSLAHLTDDVLEELLALGSLLGDRADELVVRVRIGVAEAQVLELPLDLIDTETVRERRVDVAGLHRDLPLAIRILVLHGTHVVETVRELDEDNADVLGHREEHLAHVLRLLLFLRRIRDPAEFGNAVDQERHVLAEDLGNEFTGNRGILDRIVQERRDERVGVDFKLRQDLRSRDRVDDVRLAGLSLLRAVGLIRENEGAADPVRLVLVRVRLIARDDLVEHVEDLIAHIRRHRLVTQLREKLFHLGCDLFRFLVVTTHLIYPRPLRPLPFGLPVFPESSRKALSGLASTSAPRASLPGRLSFLPVLLHF